MAEQLCSGSRVWCWLKSPTGTQKDGQFSWMPAMVISNAVEEAGKQQQQMVRVKLMGTGPLSGSVCDVPVASALLQNPDGQDAEDMTTLTHLNEPSVLHNLDTRYGRDFIYTNTGSILIAVNPFKKIPALVSPQMMQLYQQHGPGQAKLAPHVYSTAVSAYKQMLRDKAGQAILITGESGAGKTETCKLIMRCLAHLGTAQGLPNGTSVLPNGAGLPSPVGTQQQGMGLTRASSVYQSSGSVEQMVLESNPLLEAFGNAKTSRNDNSSRFGKYVEIQFDEEGVLQGAAIRTYLLERSRVVHVVQGERSFHAFYQVCAGASPAQRSAWHLGTAGDFAVLRQSDCRQLVGVDDGEEFKATCHAMSSVGMSTEQQEEVFATLAAILHLGNLQWAEPAAAGPVPAGPAAAVAAAAVRDAPAPADATSWQALIWAAELLQVDAGQLLAAVSTRTRQTPDGPIVSPLSPAGADEARNALCKVLYSRIFTWIVACVNASLRRNRTAMSSPNGYANGNGNGLPHVASGNGLHTPNGYAQHAGANSVYGSPVANGKRMPVPEEMGTPPRANGLHDSQEGGLSIGLLDIYGFESFEMNDLEQLCINLANEKLQQHFNQHVFKWEQAEYTREGVDWRYIDFVDNQEVLDLVEGKLGLLDLLDEQCRFPTATADDLAHKYSSTPSVAGSKRFEKLKRERTGFAIQHYAGPVKYQTDNFLEKNKDFVVAEQAALMSSSSSDLVSALFAEPSMSTGGGTGTPQQNNMGGTPGSASKSAFKFDSVASQFKRQLADLMAALHKAQPHYIRCIKPNAGNRPGAFDSPYVLQQLQCGGVMEAVRISCAGFSYKRPYAAFLDYFWLLCPSALHGLRKYDTMRHCHSEGDVLASHTSGVSRSHLPASQLLQQQLPPEALKAAAQQVLANAGVKDYHLGVTKLFLKAAQAALLEKLRSLVVGKAVVKIQTRWRGWNARTSFVQLKGAAVAVQAWVRAQQARALAQRLREERAATVLQTAWRARAARVWAQRNRQAAAVLQGAWRARAVRLALYEQFRERAALVMQSVWRTRSVWKQRRQEVVYHQAAVRMQTYWRARVARRHMDNLLPRHESATKIQRAWRQNRAGLRLREKFRNVVRRAMEVSKAVHFLQTAWRAKAGRLVLARLRRVAHRQRFQQQLKMFEAPPPQTSPVMRPKGPKPLLPYQIKQMEAAKQRAEAEARGDTQVRDTQPRGLPAPSPAPDQRPAQHFASVVVPVRVAPQQELGEFKLTPILQMWKSMDQNTAVTRQPTLNRQNSAVRYTPTGRASFATRSASVSPASQSSYGQLLNMPAVPAAAPTAAAR